MVTNKTRRRRSPEEMIEDLQREIARLKDAQKLKTSPGRKQARLGLKALQKAQALAADEGDPELDRALGAALGALEGLFSGEATAGVGGAGGVRVRRTSDDLAQLQEQMIAFLDESPGTSISEIAVAVGASPKELRGPLVALVEEGRVKKTGERRGTRYFLSSSKRARRKV